MLLLINDVTDSFDNPRSDCKRVSFEIDVGQTNVIISVRIRELLMLK